MCSARSTSRASQPHCGSEVLNHQRCAFRQLPERSSRLGGDSERRDSEVSKLTSERQRSAAAPFRPRRSLGFVAEPMLYRRPANPSRRRIVSPPAETLVLHDAKRSPEPTASLRRSH